MSFGKRIFVERVAWEASVKIYLGDFRQDGIYILEPGAWVLKPEGAAPSGPLITLTDENAMGQQLMDGLWDAGVRPSSNRIAEVSATQEHLKDAQTLIEKLLPSALRKPERPRE